MPPTDRSRPGLVAESLARHGVAAPRGPHWTREQDVLARAGGAAREPGSPWVYGQNFTIADLVRFTDPATRTPDPSDPDE